MVDIRSSTMILPPFIERSYFISPGVVSVIFKVIWSIFTFLVVTFLIQYGFAAAGIKESEAERNQKSLWNLHQDYSRVQNMSNERWGGMALNLPSTRVILGILFWAVIYVFELLFSLSINNAYITHYDGTACVGRVNDFNTLYSTMFYNARNIFTIIPPQNSTLLRQLLNENQVGNIVLLGDGIFAISPTNALYKKNQAINVARAGFNCSYTLNLTQSEYGQVYYPPLFGPNISIPYFPNFDPLLLGYLTPAHVNVKVANRKLAEYQTLIDDNPLFLILVSNPINHVDSETKSEFYTSTAFLQECLLFYEHGVVTIAEDGYLNKTNIGESYLKVENDTVATEFLNSNLGNLLFYNTTFLSLLDYPDELLDVNYNKSYLETMKIANNIVAARLLNGLDPNADLCTFNQEQVPVYFSVIGTTMSFGYILMGVVSTVVALLALSALAFTKFTQEERNRWLLYSNDWRFTGYLSTGSNMDQKTFKENAKNIHVQSNDSKDELQENENDLLHSEALLQKK